MFGFGVNLPDVLGKEKGKAAEQALLGVMARLQSGELAKPIILDTLGWRTSIVVQSGDLDGQPRNIFATRPS